MSNPRRRPGAFLLAGMGLSAHFFDENQKKIFKKVLTITIIMFIIIVKKIPKGEMGNEKNRDGSRNLGRAEENLEEASGES